MALSAEEAAVNTAARAYYEALATLYAAGSAGDEVVFTAPDDGGDDVVDRSYVFSTSDGSTITSSIAVRFVTAIRGDGDFPFLIPAGEGGSMVPLCWFVTNENGDLSA